MSDEELKRSLSTSLASRSPLGPKDANEPPLELPASLLKETLLSAEPERDPGWLRLRQVKILGSLDLSGCVLAPRVSLVDCEFDDHFDCSQGTASSLELTRCHFKKRVVLDQIEVKWNLQLDGSSFAAGLSLYDASIGGQLSLQSISCSVGALGIPAIGADDLKVGTDLLCGHADIEGCFTVENAQIGGEFFLRETKLSHQKQDKGAAVSFMGDGIKVGGGLSAAELEAEGEVRIIDACIDGMVNFAEANFEGRGGGEETSAFSADRANLSGALRAKKMQARGQVRMLSLKVGGQLSMDGAEIEGEFLLLGAKINGELGLNNAVLNGDGRPALSADRIEIGGGMFCSGLKATGEVRLLGAKIGGQLMLLGAELDGSQGLSREEIALNANGMSISDAVLCERVEAQGALSFNGARVNGGVTFLDARLSSGPGQRILVLLGAHADELVLRLANAEGTVDLRHATVRTLWDGRDGDIERLSSLRLEGFDYQTLAEPLDAERRLKWIAPSQDGQYLPGVFIGLAQAFRRMGHRGDARKVEIEAARRAIDQLPSWHPRWLWNKLLWLTTGSGYRNWLAAVWLLALLAIGTLVFWHCESDFIVLSKNHPPFNPLLYAVDVTVPVIEVGQQRAFAATGWLRWLALFLTASGYALVTAVIAAVAGLLNPDQRA